MYIKKI